MAWLTALFKAILEWLSAEVKKDTKASDADATSKDLKDRWRKRIQQQEKKLKNEKNSNSDSNQFAFSWMRFDSRRVC